MFLPEILIFLLAILFYMGGVLIHIFTITKVIPFNYINGGRSESYEVQAKQSKISIFILLIGALYVLLGMLFPSFKKSIAFMVLAFILALLWLLGTIMQLIGTKFERYYLSWVNLIGVLSHVELALIYFSGDE